MERCSSVVSDYCARGGARFTSQAERFSAARKARVKARIRTAMTFMHRRMEDELARQLMLDEEFGMPSDATGKECVHRVEGLKAGQTFQFQVSVATAMRFHQCCTDIHWSPPKRT